MQSRCMCGASVYELDFFFFFLIPPPLPKSSFFGLIMSTVNRGIECSLLELRPPISVKIRPLNLSEHADWQGFSVTVCFTCLVDEEGSTFFAIPHRVLAILSHISKLPKESAEGEMTTATIGHCNVWFKFPSVSNWFIPLYGFNFGKYRAAGFLQVV